MMNPDRRTVLGGALAMAGGKAADPHVPGGNGPMRPDQALNAAHRSPPLPPGAQSGLIRATIIIVSGGVVGGVFVYNGKPGLGNPPIVSITAGTKDPFGNTVVPGLDVTEGSITGTTISGSTFSGTDFVINSAGAFFYSGTPALGNLVYAIANQPGNDAFGNNYIGGGGIQYGSSTPGGFFALAPGLAVVGANAFGGTALLHSATAGGPYADLGGFTLYSAGGAATQFVVSGPSGGTPLTAALAEIQGSLAADSVAIAESSGTGGLLSIANSATATGNPNVQLTGTGATDNMVGIEITGDTNNRLKIDASGKHQWGSGAAGQDTDLFRGAANLLQTDDSLAFTNSGAIGAQAGAAILTAANGQMQSVNASGLNYNLAAAQPANFNKNTVTGAALANLSTFNIPSGDPITGAVYTFDIFGYGQWGNPATQLTFQATIGGNQFALTAIAAGALAAAAVFQWNARLTVACTATGSGGTWRCSLSGSLQQTANALNPGAAASNSVAFSLGEGSAADIAGPTNAALAVQLLAEWASAANGATITKSTSYPARMA